MKHVDHTVLLLLGQDLGVCVLLVLMDLLGVEPGLEHLVQQTIVQGYIFSLKIINPPSSRSEVCMSQKNFFLD